MSGPTVGPHAEASVRPALAAAGLVVAQQVAAKATRDALFLSNFPVTALPVASGLTAGLALVGALAFARAMTRSSPPILMRRVLAASAVLLGAEWALSLVRPRWAAVAVYVHVGVFGATLASGFWSVVNERFDPHTARRFVGRIGGGAALGGVAGGLLTWQASTLFGVSTMLLLVAGLASASLIALEVLHRSAPPSAEAAAAPEEHPPAARGWALISGHRYLRLVAFLVGLGAVTEAILDYVLNAAVVARVATGGALMSFFALYHASVGTAAFGVQTTLARGSLARLGLGGTLAIQPLAVALGGLFATVVPGLWVKVTLRGAQSVLRNSLFRSAYELLYTPLPPEWKRSTKALLDVGADRLGTMAGSAVVMAFLLLPGDRATDALTLLASALAVLCLLLTRHLQKGYVAALAESLRAGTGQPPGVGPDRASGATLGSSAAGEWLGAPAEPREPGTPPSAAPLENTWLEAAADLRSQDQERIRAVLAREMLLSPELVPLVIPLLARDDLFAHAVTALRRVAARSTGQLLDALLDPGGDPLVRRRVPRVLKAVPTQRAVDGLVQGLQDERFDVRYRSAQALLSLSHRDRTLAVPAPAAFETVERELSAANPSPRGLDHVFVLLALARPDEPVQAALRAWRMGDATLRGTALEYMENVLPATVWSALWPWLGAPAVATGRTVDEMRDDLLRSTASWTMGRRSRRPPA